MSYKFGTDDSPNLSTISKVLEESIESYNRWFAGTLVFAKPEKMRFTPEKTYTARTDIPAFCDGNKVGTLYAILFAPCDGTGDESAFSLGDLTIPAEYEKDNRPEAVLPRKKTCFIEACLPFFSIYTDTPHHNVVSLEELGVKDDKLVKLWDIGCAAEQYHRNAFTDFIVPYAHLTTWHAEPTMMVGNPHSIYYNPKLVVPKAPPILQVVGFISAKKDDPHCAVLQVRGRRVNV